MSDDESTPGPRLTSEEYFRVHMDAARRLTQELEVRDRATLHVAMAQAWATLTASQAHAQDMAQAPTSPAPSEDVTRAHSHADGPTTGDTLAGLGAEVFSTPPQTFTMGTVYVDADHHLWAITTTTRGGVPLMQSLLRNGSIGDPGTFHTLEWVLEQYGPLTPYEGAEITASVEPPEGESYRERGRYYQSGKIYQVRLGELTGTLWAITEEAPDGAPLMREVSPEGTVLDVTTGGYNLSDLITRAQGSLADYTPVSHHME